MSNPPALPAQLSRPDAQLIIDALNLRIHALELEGKGLTEAEVETIAKTITASHAQGRTSSALELAGEVAAPPNEAVVRLTTSSTATVKKITAEEKNTNQVVVLHQTAAKTLTVKDGENLKLAGEASLGENDTLTLICDGSNWIELARSNN